MSLVRSLRSHTAANRAQTAAPNPDTFGDLYHITDDAIPGDPDPTDLDSYLNVLTEVANRLGFVSIMDATLADTRRYMSTTSISDRMKEFAQTGCFGELFRLYRESGAFRNLAPQLLGEKTCQLSQLLYEQEFNEVRKLDTLNKPMAEWNHDYFAAFDFVRIYEEIKEKPPNLVGLLDMLSSNTYEGVSSCKGYTLRRARVL
jgi:hypothetical protein